MVHGCHEMVRGTYDPAGGDGELEDGFFREDLSDTRGVGFAADGLGEELAEELAVVEDKVVGLGEAAEYEGC